MTFCKKVEITTIIGHGLNGKFNILKWFKCWSEFYGYLKLFTMPNIYYAGNLNKPAYGTPTCPFSSGTAVTLLVVCTIYIYYNPTNNPKQLKTTFVGVVL